MVVKMAVKLGPELGPVRASEVEVGSDRDGWDGDVHSEVNRKVVGAWESRARGGRACDDVA